jgi:hypothetical protein
MGSVDDGHSSQGGVDRSPGLYLECDTRIKIRIDSEYPICDPLPGAGRVARAVVAIPFVFFIFTRALSLFLSFCFSQSLSLFSYRAVAAGFAFSQFTTHCLITIASSGNNESCPNATFHRSQHGRGALAALLDLISRSNAESLQLESTELLQQYRLSADQRCDVALDVTVGYLIDDSEWCVLFLEGSARGSMGALANYINRYVHDGTSVGLGCSRGLQRVVD